MDALLRLGIDVGSTTLKCALIDETGAVLFKSYARHAAKIQEALGAALDELAREMPQIKRARATMTGSAGMGLAKRLKIAFEQEVYATRRALALRVPDAEVAIELGGEDAKILFLKDENGNPALEARMNGSCAGGTGAFIDQMATLLGVSANRLDEMAKDFERVYPIASRCGVFAKSDVQPLINQGAKVSDIAASILESVVSQTVAGLAQGRKIAGNVVYLGGPITFLPQLKLAFDRSVGPGTLPEDSLYFAAIGAAGATGTEIDIEELRALVKNDAADEGYPACKPLFADARDYAAFAARHAENGIMPASADEGGDSDSAFIGVDAGSTTVKAVAIDGRGRVLMSQYALSAGTPLARVKAFLERFYGDYPRMRLRGCAATGYGEELVKNAFRFDMGVVETIAHFTAAKAFRPDVDFIIDIGGQDIKCFKIRNGAIDNIFLNEACSSGCGSFLQTFAGAWGLSAADFAKKGLTADRPVDLGSRCTVFMNSCVKQAQKDGASIENISAGLSISVVKNALYKVIRAASADEVGQNIVVQGGTFLNDAVLRAFENEIGRSVVRPEMAGLMGAYGAALIAREKRADVSSALTLEELKAFDWSVKTVMCQGCGNLCRLNVNSFAGGREYISGNRCQRALAGGGENSGLNIYEEKRRLIEEISKAQGAGTRGTIGIPLGLNMYELLPFWHTLLCELGFEVTVSRPSTRETYLRGQRAIPSDTVCYPAKIMHGHADELLKKNVDAVFYPCMSYNFDERAGDNHYNCPVVAYYPEVVGGNADAGRARFIRDYLGPHDKRAFPKRFYRVISRYFPQVTRREVNKAARLAYARYYEYMDKIRGIGREIIKKARERQMPVVVLAGRPYHIDAEICHSIDKLLGELGCAVVSEDAVAGEVAPFPVSVLNQWTYHARLYAAAKYVAESEEKNICLVQLVSFGCGVDAITGDEVRAILESAGKIYTQIKIDEISNLSAARIRLRSLFAAMGREGLK